MGRTLPVLDGPDGVIALGADPSSDRRVGRRDHDRRVALGGIVVSLAFIALAVATTAAGGDRWSALHLLLAGGAGTAIGAVMPFFAAALVAAPPADARVRILAIGCLALGAAIVAVAVPGALRAPSLSGAGVYLLGLAVLAVVTVAPVRRGLAPRRLLVLGGYALAVGFVLIGVALALALLHGFEPVVGRWATLKPAHAWLNLIGFVGLVIAATVTHLVPTVLGARIVEGRLASTAIGGLGLGVAAVASGFAVGSDPLVGIGAVVASIGALAVPVIVWAAARQTGRGRWTTDAAWHAFTGWTLGCSAVWFAVGVGLAAATAVVYGATPAGWSLAAVVAPLAIGCVLQVVLGAVTHLLPTLGSGTPADRARARATLGLAARPRVIAFQVGVVLWMAGPLTSPAAAGIGAVLVAIPVVLTLGLATTTLLRWRLAPLA